MTQQDMYLHRAAQGATLTPPEVITEGKRILCISRGNGLELGRPIHRTVVLPHDVIAPAELQAILMIESQHPQKAAHP